HLPVQAGDVAPDLNLTNLANRETLALSALRGKVVCLELWATWCGPCQGPLEKLNHLAAEKRDAWQNQVAIVPLSIDEAADLVAPPPAARGLAQLSPYWSGGGDPANTRTVGWQSPAAQAFGINGVPTTMIIARGGKVVWRAHPADTSDGK